MIGEGGRWYSPVRRLLAGRGAAIYSRGRWVVGANFRYIGEIEACWCNVQSTLVAADTIDRE